MKFTEITYKYEYKTYTTVERENDYKKGDVNYEQGVLNRIESLTRAGAVITDVFQHDVREGQ